MKRSVSVQFGVLAGVALLAACGGSTTVEPLPSPFTSIAVGAIHTCALVQDGSAFCWGNNGFGQLGDGTQSDRDAPVAVAGSAEKLCPAL